MNRTQIIGMLNSVGVAASADRWTDSIVCMPGNLFYEAEEFRMQDSYTDIDGARTVEPVLVYAGDAEFNAQYWPMGTVEEVAA